MASVLKVDTITGVATAGSIAVTGEGNSTTTNLQQGLAKAWANIEPKAAPTLHDSNNVGSLTDHGTAEYSINLTNGMSAIRSVYYSVTGTAQDTSGGGASTNIKYTASTALNLPTSTNWPLRTVSGTGASTEAGDYVGTAIFGDLA